MKNSVERHDTRWERLTPRQRWSYAWREARKGSDEGSYLNPHMFPLLRQALAMVSALEHSEFLIDAAEGRPSLQETDARRSSAVEGPE